MTNRDYRALCANLTAALNDWQCETGDDRYAALINRARAALAQPEPPRLKEALEALERMQDLYPHMGNARTIRRALEAL